MSSFVSPSGTHTHIRLRLQVPTTVHCRRTFFTECTELSPNYDLHLNRSKCDIPNVHITRLFGSPKRKPTEVSRLRSFANDARKGFQKGSLGSIGKVSHFKLLLPDGRMVVLPKLADVSEHVTLL